jgi:hypothetical protein
MNEGHIQKEFLQSTLDDEFPFHETKPVLADD